MIDDSNEKESLFKIINRVHSFHGVGMRVGILLFLGYDKGIHR